MFLSKTGTHSVYQINTCNKSVRNDEWYFQSNIKRTEVRIGSRSSTTFRSFWVLWNASQYFDHRTTQVRRFNGDISSIKLYTPISMAVVSNAAMLRAFVIAIKSKWQALQWNAFEFIRWTRSCYFDGVLLILLVSMAKWYFVAKAMLVRSWDLPCLACYLEPIILWNDSIG